MSLFALVVLGTVTDAAKAGLIVDKYQGNVAGGGGLTRADQVIAGSYFTPNQTLGTEFATINFSDFGNRGDFADPTNLWPDNTNNDQFVAHVYGNVLITTAGTYTFRTSNDDGLRLRIDGIDVIVDDSYHAEAAFTGSIFLAAGWHTVDLVFFERDGAATLELQVQNSSGAFVLLGDTANGGLETTATAVPEPGTLALAGMGIFGLAGYVRRRRAKVAV